MTTVSHTNFCGHNQTHNQQDMDATPAKRARFGSKAKNQVLIEFRKNVKMLNDLKTALKYLDGCFANLRLLRIVETNARTSASFTKATCTTKSFLDEDKKVVKYAFKSIFSNGFEVLKKYVYTNQIPEDSLGRKTLGKLIQCLKTSATSLKRPEKNTDKCKWAVQLAQHLFSQLAIGSKYTIDKNYQKKGEDLETCPCEESDKLTEEYGDTSFGCPGAWHGSVDILFEDAAILLAKDEDIKDEAYSDGLSSDSAVNSNDSSVDVKSGGENMDKYGQILAQCIVFSFLQRKLNAPRMDHFLVPSFGVNSTAIVMSFYDSKNDILLQSADLPLFVEGTVDVKMIVCVWLAMNHRCFCSGVPESMKVYKAEFHDRVGDYLQKYVETVNKYMYVDCIGKPLVRVSHQDTSEDNWETSTRVKFDRNPPKKRRFVLNEGENEDENEESKLH